MKTVRSPLVFFAAGTVLFIVALATVSVRAQSSSATPASAHVRLWKTELRDFAKLRVSLVSARGRHPVALELGGGGPGYLFGNYTEAPAGHGTLEVFAGADKRPLVDLSTDVAPGAFVTIFLQEPEKAGSPPRLEVIEDSDANTDPEPAQIIVRNFVANLKDLQVKVGDNLSAQFAFGSSFLQMSGIKPTMYTIRTSGTGPDGKPFEWNTDTDLKQHHRQTLLVYPDTYGRIRPRLCVDGEFPSASESDNRH